MRRILLRLLPGICCLLLGCAGGKADVTGRVSHQGKPVTTGTVVVRGADGVQLTGTIQPDGTYTVRGVTSGEVRFAVVSRDPAVVGARARLGKGRADGKEEDGTKGKAAKPTGPPAPTGNWFPLPDRYESAETSGLSTTLRGGENTFDLALS